MAPDLTEMEKLAYLLDHWQEHNDEHIKNYHTWAERAQAQGHEQTASLLKDAADTSARINELFSQAKAALEKR